MKNLLLTVLVLIACPFLALAATTSYYVDSGRSSNGSGTQASPWNAWGNINWSTVSTSLGSGPVNIYLSSRGPNYGPGTLTTGASGTGSSLLSIIGDSFYNTNATGTATWFAESNTNNRALLFVGSFATPNAVSNIWLQGLEASHSPNGAFVVGSGVLPTVNTYNITLTNCYAHDATNTSAGHGFWFGYSESGCFGYRVAGCTVSNVANESVYLGHYNYLPQTMTNCIIENNLIINAGIGGEGEIDIKPPAHGAIVRGNTIYRTVSTPSACGIVIASDACQVYNNSFYYAKVHSVGQGADWGWGIFLQADADAINGLQIDSCLIYNNLIYSNDWSGIKILTTLGKNISGVRIYNNVIVGNGVINEGGLTLSASGSGTITIAEMKNNIFVNNRGYDVSLQGVVQLALADYNLYYRSTGTVWRVAGINQTWNQWKAFGFDAHGINADPLFVGGGDFHIQGGSPAINAGTSISSYFTTDIAGVTRPQGPAWDIGAYEFLGGLTIVTQPQNTNVFVSQNAIFTVVVNNTGSVTYQWSTNGVPITGATNASYTNVNCQLVESGKSFTVVVSDSSQSVQSTAAILTVSADPVITTQPQNVTVAVGQSAVFTVVASGQTTLSYQWKTNNVDVSGATYANYTNANSQLVQSNMAVKVVVTDTAGSLTSSTGRLYVVQDPRITQQPQNITVNVGQNATFNVIASGTSPFSYQWYLFSTNLISGATNSAFTKSSTQITDSGNSYSVVVSNPNGTTTSTNAVLTVLGVSPVITQQPSSVNAIQGQAASFVINASGSLPLYYQWRTNFVEDTSGNANGTTYTLSNLSTNQSGTLIDCIVTNAFGSAQSQAATLYVSPAFQKTHGRGRGGKGHS